PGRRRNAPDPGSVNSGNRRRRSDSFYPGHHVRQSALYGDPTRHAHPPNRIGIGAHHARRAQPPMRSNPVEQAFEPATSAFEPPFAHEPQRTLSHRIQYAPMITLALLMASGLTLSAQPNPYTTASDISQGKRIFQGHCAGCHGPGGEGGRGAILARPTLTRAT